MHTEKFAHFENDVNRAEIVTSRVGDNTEETLDAFLWHMESF
jgi:hypothetical protein